MRKVEKGRLRMMASPECLLGPLSPQVPVPSPTTPSSSFHTTHLVDVWHGGAHADDLEAFLGGTAGPRPSPRPGVEGCGGGRVGALEGRTCGGWVRGRVKEGRVSARRDVKVAHAGVKHARCYQALGLHVGGVWERSEGRCMLRSFSRSLVLPSLPAVGGASSGLQGLQSMVA